MQIRNIHEREFEFPAQRVGALVDSLASSQDLLWPKDMWPCIEFDRPLSVGATGGHGPIRYQIEEYYPGSYVRFRFLGPPGFDGYHAFQIVEVSSARTLLRHTLEMNTHGLALISWPVVFRPLHNALIEDSLARAEASPHHEPRVLSWSPWVRLLRWVLFAGKARQQHAPSNTIHTDASSAAGGRMRSGDEERR